MKINGEFVRESKVHRALAKQEKFEGRSSFFVRLLIGNSSEPALFKVESMEEANRIVEICQSSNKKSREPLAEENRNLNAKNMRLAEQNKHLHAHIKDLQIKLESH